MHQKMRTSASEEPPYSHWNPPAPDCGRLLWTTPYYYQLIFVRLGLHLVVAHLCVKVPRAGVGEGRTFSVFELNCHLLLSVEPLKGRGNPLSSLPKDTTSEPAYLRTRHLKLNVKQGSYEYQLFDIVWYFGPTRRGNQSRVFRQRGGQSNLVYKKTFMLPAYMFLSIPSLIFGKSLSISSA